MNLKKIGKIITTSIFLFALTPLASFAATYTAGDVATHNIQSDCWVIYSGKVYNITNYLPYHSGGINTILPYCGNNITAAFNAQGHSNNASNLLATFYVGDLATSTVPDTTAPVITILGVNPVSVTQGFVYYDAGATALDNVDGNITPRIAVTNNVNTSATGTYAVYYNVSDTAGNAATQAVRTVNVLSASTSDSSIIKIKVKKAKLSVGQSKQFVAIAYGPNHVPLTPQPTFTWTSSNTSIATVNASGLVTGISAGGPVTITASSGNISGAVRFVVKKAHNTRHDKHHSDREREDNDDDEREDNDD